MFGYPVETSDLFHSNESAIIEMLSVRRSSSPQACDESSMTVAKGLLNELHPSFRKVLTVVTTSANGDCFYEAVSLALFGNVQYMELIRLCTAFMLVRYSTVFEIVFPA